ncbi:kynurenine formamidase-like [Trichogramma pretiosum]|uniref:kynurenine formamidase-like n=1 Tax=Trichogramma pretiosum TaxID=7493 RepID=UPI0006C9B217|nr:kynurenine formamidase-like [Trichogramma pretiosum]
MSSSVVNEKVEYDYMPSNWSKRYGPTELLARYFKFCENTTAQVRGSIEHELDVPYASSEKAKYDVYGTNLPDDAPILLFIHGGYWMEFSKDLSGFAVPNFVANGVKVVLAGYDLCPNVRLPDIVRQIKTLVAKLLNLAKNLGSKGVWLAGHSAGAHLAASLLHDPDWLAANRASLAWLRGAWFLSGVYALEPLLRTSVQEALRLTPEEIEKYTFAPLDEGKQQPNQQHSGLDNFKAVVVVGESDSPIFVEESRRYARRLTSIVDNVEYLLLRNDVDHFDIVENLTKADFVLSRHMVDSIKRS